MDPSKVVELLRTYTVKEQAEAIDAMVQAALDDVEANLGGHTIWGKDDLACIPDHCTKCKEQYREIRSYGIGLVDRWAHADYDEALMEASSFADEAADLGPAGTVCHRIFQVVTLLCPDEEIQDHYASGKFRVGAKTA